jgi:hypothetical protein
VITPGSEIDADLRAIFDITFEPAENYEVWRERVIHLTRQRIAAAVVGSCCHGDPENVPCLPCWSASVVVRGSASPSDAWRRFTNEGDAGATND